MNYKIKWVICLQIIMILGCAILSTIQLTGNFHTIFVDPLPGSGLQGKIVYVLIDYQWKLTYINIVSNTKLIGVQGINDFDRKKVKIIGKLTSKTNLIEAVSIELI